MRKGLLLAGTVVAVLLVAGFAYLSLIDVNQFRPRIQAAIQKQLGRPVTLGTMSLKIFPLAIRIADVSIAEDPAFPTGRPFATAGEVRASASLLPLIRKELQIKSFVLNRPRIELVRNASGKWNFSSLGHGGAGDGGGGLSIKALLVEDGRVAVSELGKSRSVYDRIGIRLEDFAPDRRFRLAMTAALPGAAGQSVRLTAAGGPPADPDAPLSGVLEIVKAGSSALRQFMGAGEAPASATVDGKVGFSLRSGVLDARPSLLFDRVKVQGRDLGRTVELDGEIQHDLNSGVLRIPGLRASAGGVPLVISGQLNTKDSNADLTARAKNAPLAELLALASVLGLGGVTGSGTLDLDVNVKGPLERGSELRYAGQGAVRNASLNLPQLAAPLELRSADLRLLGDKASIENLNAALSGSNFRGNMAVRNFAAPAAAFNLEVDKLDLDALQKIVREDRKTSKSSAPSRTNLTAKGTLAAGTLSYNGLVLENLRSGCAFAGNVLTLAPLTAQVYGGTGTGAVTVDLRQSPPVVAMNTKLESVNADKLLSATTSLKNTLYGFLAASGNATMKLGSGAAAQSLNGDLAIRLTQGRLAGIDVMNQLASVAKFAGFAQNPRPFTDIVALTGNILVRDGIAQTNNLLLQLSGVSLGASGTVNLVNQAVDLKATAVLDSSATQQAGGTRVGGYLSTALMNNKGEMVIPAIVTGTLSQPRFAPDAARFAEMKLKNLLPSAGGMGGAAAGVIGALKGDKSAGRSVLDSLIGKPAHPQQPATGQPGAAPAAPQQPDRTGGLRGILDQIQKQTQQQKPAPSTAPAPPKQ